MKKPLWVYLTYPIHLATRGWLKYQCYCCDHDEYHYGMAAVMGWVRDQRTIWRLSESGFRYEHPRVSRVFCAIGRHEAIVLSSDHLEPGSCTRCGKMVHADILDVGGEK